MMRQTYQPYVYGATAPAFERQPYADPSDPVPLYTEAASESYTRRWRVAAPRLETFVPPTNAVSFGTLLMGLAFDLLARLRGRTWLLLIALAVIIGMWATPKSTLPRALRLSNAPYVSANSAAPDPAPAVSREVVSASATNHTVVGKPSVSADKIAAVLRSYNSPAIGAAQAMYDLGAKYGIDPAYALAFFIQESNAGTKGVARTSLSIGNIRWTTDCNCANVSGYRGYPTWAAGIEDWYKLIKNLYVGGWGLQTTDTIIPRYAPSADSNDPASYTATVNRLVAGWRTGQ